MPVPVTLFLIVTGSLVAQGAMDVWSAIAIAAVGSVAGDQIGYAVGRWGGKALVARLSGMLGKSWGGAGVFFRQALARHSPGTVDQSR